MKILHVITGLNTGGAEMVLFRLLQNSKRERFEHEVVSLTDLGPIAGRIRALGINVSALNFKRNFTNPQRLLTLVRVIRRFRPHIVQTWLYHADFLGGIAARLAGCKSPIWSIHYSNLDPIRSKRSTIWISRLCAVMSRRIPKCILCCSNVAREMHIRIGYDPSKFVMIPNGFDLDKFKPDAASRFKIRSELAISEDTVLIGMIARYDPQKDYLTFVAAAGSLCRGNTNVAFVLCGDGVNDSNAELMHAIRKTGFETRFSLLGRRDDTTDIHAALDIFTLSSAFGEAFPLVIGEAMACGTPCVATDVGDTSLIIGSTGKVVGVRDPEALANSWRDLILCGSDARRGLGALARSRINANYNLTDVVSRYESVYSEHGS